MLSEATAATALERPIIFSAHDVRATLEGRKTQTRRIVRPQPPYECAFEVGVYNPTKIDRRGEEYPGTEVFGMYSLDGKWGRVCPYGPGDLLWVREPWADLRGMGFGAPFAYLADSLNRFGREDGDARDAREYYGVKWRPSIHMPREASRLILRVTNVRVERVQEISEGDAIAEGWEPLSNANPGNGGPFAWFRYSWDSIYAKRGLGWDTNPFVWVIEFEVVEVSDRAE